MKLQITPQDLQTFINEESILFARDGKRQLNVNLIGNYEYWHDGVIEKTFDNIFEACNYFNKHEV